MASGHPRRLFRFLAVFCIAFGPALRATAGTDPGIFVIRADEGRARIWVLAADGVYVHEQSTQQSRRMQLPGWMHASRSVTGMPDLIVEANGVALVSSNIVPNLWRVDAESGTAVEIAIDLGHEGVKDIGFTSLRMSNAGVVTAKSTIDQSTWRVDLRGRRAWKD